MSTHDQTNLILILLHIIFFYTQIINLFFCDQSIHYTTKYQTNNDSDHSWYCCKIRFRQQKMNDT